MKTIKKVVLYFILLMVVANAYLILTGHSYIYKGLVNTYFKGRSGPEIDEYPIFAFREVKTGQFKPLPVAKDYNRCELPEAKFNLYNPVAYLVIQHDSIKYERYWEGYGEDSYSNSFSMAKSFVGALIGCAIQDGYIKSVDQAVGDFIPQYKNGANQHITIKHLLMMRSGINFDENYVSPFAYPAAAYYGTDISGLTLKYEGTETPGESFKYLSGNTELLGMIIEKATGKKLANYMGERLWAPLGAKHPAKWSLDHEGGMEKAYCCFNSNARDFARLGMLYLHHGNWFGNQLIPAAYIAASTTGTSNYGYQWWIVHHNNHAYPCCRGILGQYIILIPEKDMVVVRLGHKRSKDRVGDNPLDIFLYIDAALEMAEKKN